MTSPNDVLPYNLLYFFKLAKWRFFYNEIQKTGPDPFGEISYKQEELVNDIKHLIDELSNLKSLRQLEIETARARQASKDIEERNKVQKYQSEQARERMLKIEEEDRERCRKTAEIFKDFQKKTCNGPFFSSLLDILTNFQGTIIFYYQDFLNFLTITTSSYIRRDKFHSTDGKMYE